MSEAEMDPEHRLCMTTNVLYGCRQCGVFAYSPPIVHRPEHINAGPMDYEPVHVAPSSYADEVRRLHYIEDQLQHSIEDIASLTSYNLNLAGRLEALRQACAAFDDSVCDIISGDAPPDSLLDHALPDFRKAHGVWDEAEPSAFYLVDRHPVDYLEAADLALYAAQRMKDYHRGSTLDKSDELTLLQVREMALRAVGMFDDCK